ncbi:TetR/AcrR family transcriptional regulator [Streptomyces sp. NPDC051018]|uniref:TetR/AcrR family transcriptional regulator n=1 Tax=Streptomyces sp. NPDC051018 TaxID=3365639 RepID=UPI0037BB49BB
MARMSAEERRESVIRVAMSEFARGGYHGTSTGTIAERVGVSQPYLFRLFKNKRELFLAVAIRCIEETPQAFAGALEEWPDRSPKEAMALAYQRLIGDRERLLMQMQIYVAVATATATGDVEFGERIRSAWVRIWEQARGALGGDDHDVTEFMAYGMLINTLVSLGFPGDHRVWRELIMDGEPTCAAPDRARPGARAAAEAEAVPREEDGAPSSGTGSRA